MFGVRFVVCIININKYTPDIYSTDLDPSGTDDRHNYMQLKTPAIHGIRLVSSASLMRGRSSASPWPYRRTPHAGADVFAAVWLAKCAQPNRDACHQQFHRLHRVMSSNPPGRGAAICEDRRHYFNCHEESRSRKRYQHPCMNGIFSGGPNPKLE